MENSEVSADTKPVSYDAAKSIVKYIDFKTRVQIRQLLPAFRKIESLFPYHFDHVAIGSFSVTVDGRTWNFHQVYQEGEDAETREESNKVDVYFQCPGYRFQHRMRISPEEAEKRLIFEYIRNNSRIKSLEFWSFPACLREKDPKKFKIHVESLKLSNPSSDLFRELQPFLAGNLKKFQFLVVENSRELLQDPVVRNCKELFLQFPYFRPIEVDDILENLTNQHIHIIHVDIPIEKIRGLAANWINTRRPIGSKFTLTIEDYLRIIDIFDDLTDSMNAIPAKLPDLGVSTFSQSVCLPIDDDSELVLHGGPMLFKWPPFNWTLVMEVMEKGSAVAKTPR